MRQIFTLIIFLGILTTVTSWGAVGHAIIARLAQSQFTAKTSEWLEPLIPCYLNGDLSGMASWADSILHSNQNDSDNWEWSGPLHYLNTPDWICNYRKDRDCADDVCIDGAIRNYSKRLIDECDIKQRKEALYFLIHFVGDIHQPLHTGFLGDRGGNSVNVTFMNNYRVIKLHSLWDSGIINHRIKNDFPNQSLYYDHIHDIMIRQNSTIPHDDDNILQWINENLNFVCQEIYFDDDHRMMNTSVRFNLSERYYQRSYPIIERRLAQGGRRLGALLNRLESTRSTSPTTTTTTITTTIKSNQMCVSTYILIIVISVECFVIVVLALVILIRHKMKHR